MPVLPPANRGRADIARAEVEQTIARFNERLTNAINAQPTAVRLWRRTKGMRSCTCSLPPRRIRTDDATQQPTPNSYPVPRADLADDDTPVYETQTQPAYEAKGETGRTFDMRAPQGTAEPDVGSDADALEILDRIDSVVSGIDDAACAICFGGGFVDRYVPHGMQRIVLTCDELYDVDSRGAEINAEDQPATIALATQDAYYLWSGVELPTYFIGLPLIRICNNRQDVLSLNLEINVNGGGWYALDEAYLKSLPIERHVADIRVRCPVDVDNGMLVFTHVELLYDLVGPVNVNFPNLQAISDWDRLGPDYTTPVEMPPVFGELERGTLIEDVDNGRLWRLTNITNRMTAARQHFGYEAEVTYVRPESYFTRIRTGKGVRLPLPYRGLEQQQGTSQ